MRISHQSAAHAWSGLCTSVFHCVPTCNPTRTRLTPQARPFLTITKTSSVGERGLIGVVCDTEWPAKPYIYVTYTVSPVAGTHVAFWEPYLAGAMYT